MDIQDFFPSYPDIDDSSFQQDILNKKEFFELRLPRQLEDINKGESLNHQKIIQRFFGPHTPYDELFINHQTGSGKSGVAFITTEDLFNSKSFSKVYVLAKGSSLLISLMKQLVYVYSKRYTVPDTVEPGNQIRYIRRMTSDFYQFQTFETFAKGLSSFSDEVLQNKYENSIFILDEVHNIKSDETATVYSQFHRLFHLLENRKILLMSATPMRDDVSELATIMNLILPLDVQLPMDVSFTNMFIRDDTIIQIDRLKQFLRGRISFLDAPQEDTRKKYMGSFLNDLNIEQFKIYPTRMGPIQLEGYSEAFLKDTTEERSIYSNSRQAALFVFPDRSYGPEGLSRYANPKTGILKNEFLAEIFTVERLKKFSSKYAFIIKNILDNPKKLVYIYCSVVNGSGVNLLAQILESYGFTKAKGTEKKPGRRYISLTSQTGNIDTPLSFFNSRRNMLGNYCQVIIGSRKISEGFSFKNIQIIHITTEHWNYTEVQQAIARGIRYKSHEYLIQSGINPIVQIYQHVSLVNQNNTEIRSIDVMMMEVSQQKDILVQKMTRIIKEISFDCPLTFERNYRVGTEGSRECDYQECEYKCDSSLEPIAVDLSTYNLYYQNIDDNINRIRKLFSEHFSLSFQSIQDTLEIDTFQLLQVLSNVIRHNIPIVNKYGLECYLRGSRNEYYLVDNVVLPNDHSELYLYTKKPYITENKSLKNTIRDKAFQYNLGIIQILSSLKTKESVKKHLDSLSLEIQELVLENAITHQYKNGPTKLIDWILSIYKPHLRNTGKYKYVSILLLPKARCFDEKWSDCIYEEIQQQGNPEVNNPYGVYGIQEGDNFCIKEIIATQVGEKKDKRKEKSGSNCLEVGWNKPRLAELCLKLQLEIPPNELNPDAAEELSRNKSGKKILLDWQGKGWTSDELSRGLYWYKKSKEEICGVLKQWFNEKKLLIQGQCGRPTKKK